MASDEAPYLHQEGMTPWNGQITFTIIAAQALAWTAFNLFKYRKDEWATHFAGNASWMEDQTTNYKWGNLIHGYGWLVFWSVALVTQLMSDFGVAAGLNTKVWMLGLGVVGMLVNLVANVLWYIDMNKFFNMKDDADHGAEATSGYTFVR
jgi:hypothetical protein